MTAPDSRWTVTEVGCWEWNGTRSLRGYGMVRLIPGAIPVGAHRAVYEEMVGPIPPGLELDHGCVNPPCVNPAQGDPPSPPCAMCEQKATGKVTFQAGAKTLISEWCRRCYKIQLTGV